MQCSHCHSREELSPPASSRLPTCKAPTSNPRRSFESFQPPFRFDLAHRPEIFHTTSSAVPLAGTRCLSDRPLPQQCSPIWSIVGRGEHECSYTTTRRLSWIFSELSVKKFVHIRRTESQQRAQLDSSNPGLPASGVIADPTLRDSKPIRNLLRTKKAIN
jgi:hypothetical protein